MIADGKEAYTKKEALQMEKNELSLKKPSVASRDEQASLASSS